MSERRTAISMSFGAVLALLYAYQLLAAWYGGGSVSLIPVVGLCCGVGLVICALFDRHKKID